MRHNNDFSKLGRTSAHRKALMRTLVTELFRHERIETTIPKAKALKRVADKMVTLAKRGDLHARRQAIAWFMDETVVARLFDVLVDQFKSRQGGYTRILRLGFRQGDNAPMGLIELVGSEHKFVQKPSEVKGEKAAKKPAPKTKSAPTKEKAAKPVKEKKAEKPTAEAKPKGKGTKKEAAGATKAAAPKKAKSAKSEKA
jgi:large subunit ribosomal protein L17